MANLNTTTTVRPVSSSDTFIPLASVANISIGHVLFVDLESMPITRLQTVGALVGVYVNRTGRAASHGPNALVYTAPPSAFYSHDPIGVPPVGVQNYWINERAGRIWVAQGDEAGAGTANRFWQLQTSTPGRGPLGIRTTTITPTQAVQ